MPTKNSRESGKNKAVHVLANWDARKLQLKNNSVDVIIADPPWKYKNRCQKQRHTTDYLLMDEQDLLDVFHECYRVLKDSGHLYLWVTSSFLPVAFKLLENSGFDYIQTLTWVKNTFGLGNYYRHRTEFVILACKGKRNITRFNNIGSVFFADNRGKSIKPLEILETFVRQSSDTGDVVLDVFSGSNQLLQSGLPRKFVLVDRRNKKIHKKGGDRHRQVNAGQVVEIFVKGGGIQRIKRSG